MSEVESSCFGGGSSEGECSMCFRLFIFLIVLFIIISKISAVCSSAADNVLFPDDEDDGEEDAAAERRLFGVLNFLPSNASKVSAFNTSTEGE